MVLKQFKSISLICAITLFFNVTSAQVSEPKEYGGKLGIGFALGGGGVAAGIPLRLNLSEVIALEAGVYLQATTITLITYDHNFYGAVIRKHRNTEYIFPLSLNGGVNLNLIENQKSSGKILRNGIVLRAGKTLKGEFTENLIAFGWSRERFMNSKKQNSFIFELGAGMFMYGDGNSPLGWAMDREVPVMPVVLWKLHWNFYVIK